uniref:Uncharacterized protein n=1 Tax=Arundo donax TaxID=35708 RepID=A0A0A8ZJD5_ARUDO
MTSSLKVTCSFHALLCFNSFVSYSISLADMRERLSLF